MHDVADVRLELQDALTARDEVPGESRRSRSRVTVAVGALVVASAFAAAIMSRVAEREPEQPIRFSMEVPEINIGRTASDPFAGWAKPCLRWPPSRAVFLPLTRSTQRRGTVTDRRGSSTVFLPGWTLDRLCRWETRSKRSLPRVVSPSQFASVAGALTCGARTMSSCSRLPPD